MNRNNIGASFCIGIFFFVVFVSDTATCQNTFTQDILALCANVSCHVGRECRVLSSGIPECVCRSHCPNRHRPVCGSDGIAYENHCQLHRHACLKGTHIRPKHFDKSCFDDPLSELKREIQEAMEELKLSEREQVKVPRACHQNDRDRMREFLMSWMTLKAPKMTWHKKDMAYRDALNHYFDDMDTDSNTYLDSTEWLHYLRNQSSTHHRDKATKKLRKLCMEALIEEGDRDQDWRLDKNEFFILLDESYVPSNKYCVRDRKHYEDGTRTKVDCNGCTCACGKWICTSHPCSPESNYHFTSTEEYANYEDMDNQID